MSSYWPLTRIFQGRNNKVSNSDTEERMLPQDPCGSVPIQLLPSRNHPSSANFSTFPPVQRTNYRQQVGSPPRPMLPAGAGAQPYCCGPTEHEAETDSEDDLSIIFNESLVIQACSSKIVEKIRLCHQRVANLQSVVTSQHAELSKKECRIKALEEQLESMTHSRDQLEESVKQLKKAAKASLLDPDQIDARYRGLIPNSKVNAQELEKSVSHFFSDGLYTELMEADISDMEQYEVGELMVSVSKKCYRSAMNVSIQKISKLFEKLFVHHVPDLTAAERELADSLTDVQHAYGLLLYHYSKYSNGHSGLPFTYKEVEKEFCKLLSEDKKLQHLFQKAMDGNQHNLFNNFVKQSLTHSIKMISLSPPMVIHTQEEFDKGIARPVVSKNPSPPLKWIQPVLYSSWSGRVLIKGRADNEDELINTDCI